MAKPSLDTLLLFGALVGCGASDDPDRSKADASDESTESPGAKLDAARPALDAASDTKVTSPDAKTSDARTVEPTDAQPRDASTTLTINVDSKDVWSASGFQVEAGRCYELTAKIDDEWLDLDVPADLSGWIDKQDPRLTVFTPFRRVAQDDIGFYQFAACVDEKLDQCFAVGTSTSVCPKATGELSFFVNDASGFESNNVGTATVTFRAK